MASLMISPWEMGRRALCSPPADRLRLTPVCDRWGVVMRLRAQRVACQAHDAMEQPWSLSHGYQDVCLQGQVRSLPLAPSPRGGKDGHHTLASPGGVRLAGRGDTRMG